MVTSKIVEPESRLRAPKSLADYVQTRLEEVKNKNEGASCCLGVLAFAGAIPLAMALKLASTVPGAIPYGIASGVIVGLIAGWIVSRTKPKVSSKVLESLKTFSGWLGKRRLHKEVEPSAVVMLDAAAEAWKRVETAITARSTDQSESEVARRKQILESARLAMDDALNYAIAHASPDEKRRIGLAVESLMKEDMETLEALMEISGGKPGTMERTLRLRPSLRGIYANAFQLFQLAELVEADRPKQLLPTSYSHHAIDETLERMRALHEAEAELEATLKLDQGSGPS